MIQSPQPFFDPSALPESQALLELLGYGLRAMAERGMHFKSFRVCELIFLLDSTHRPCPISAHVGLSSQFRLLLLRQTHRDRERERGRVRDGRTIRTRRRKGQAGTSLES